MILQEMFNNLISICGGVSEFIESFAAILGTICTIIAVLQTNKSVKKSNDQEIFEKRMDVYLTIRDVYDTCNNYSQDMLIKPVCTINGCEDLFDKLRSSDVFRDMYNKNDMTDNETVHDYRGRLKQLKRAENAIDLLWPRDIRQVKTMLSQKKKSKLPNKKCQCEMCECTDCLYRNKHTEEDKKKFHKLIYVAKYHQPYISHAKELVAAYREVCRLVIKYLSANTNDKDVWIPNSNFVEGAEFMLESIDCPPDSTEEEKEEYRKKELRQLTEYQNVALQKALNKLKREFSTMKSEDMIHQLKDAIRL